MYFYIIWRQLKGSNFAKLSILLSFNAYLSIKMKYQVSEYLLPKLNSNHISPREDDSITHCILKNEQAKQTIKKPKKKFINPEEMLYMTYIAEFQQYLTLNPKETKQKWQTIKQSDILTIFSNLSEKGYNKFEFLQFYIKVRKKSRLIERFSNPTSQKEQFQSTFYKIYKTVDDFKHKKNEETYYLIEKNDKISNILKARKAYESNNVLKIQILANLDGIVVLSKPSFTILDNKKLVDSN